MTPSYGRKWRGTREPLEKGERVERENWLKTQHSKNKGHGIWSHHFMANRWGNNGKSDRLYFLGLQKHCLWWPQPWKTMTNLGSILKSWDITLPTKVHLEKAMVFQWSCMDVRVGPLRKLSTEEWRINAFELWCWRRLLRVPWTARWSSYSILKKSVLNIHWKDWCWGWNSNTLATWCEKQTHWKRS